MLMIMTETQRQESVNLYHGKWLKFAAVASLSLYTPVTVCQKNTILYTYITTNTNFSTHCYDSRGCHKHW